MFETEAEYDGSRRRRHGRYGVSGEAEAYGPGGYGEAEAYGPGGYGEAEAYGPGGYGEAEAYGPGGYGEAEAYGPGGYGEAEAYGQGESGEAGEEGFLPLLPIVGSVLSGVLGGLFKHEVSPGGYGESEAGEAAEQFLQKISVNVLGRDAGPHRPVMSPAQEKRFAAELSEVSNEQEMEGVLGRVVNTVGQAVQGIRDAANTPQGRAVINAVKPVARAALPVIGQAIGSRFGVPQVGSAVGSAIGSLFEVPMGELSEEEQQFEVACRVVRLASAAAQDVAAAPPGAPPQLVGDVAVIRAARHHAPPLFRRALVELSPIARESMGEEHFFGVHPFGFHGGWGHGGWGHGGWGRGGWGHGGWGYHRPWYRRFNVPPPPPPPEPPPPPPPEGPPGQGEFGGYGYGSDWGHMTGGPSGRWVRRAGKIIVLDV
jgi:hypothetical protein